MKTVLVTGGSGFLGGLLIEHLLNKGYYCVNIDLEKCGFAHANLYSVQADVRDNAAMEGIFNKYKFDGILHCAAILAHVAKSSSFLWDANVEGTRNIAEFAKKYSVPKVVFTSSNCLWAKNFGRPVKEDDAPCPVEIYGKSKLEGEKILLEYSGDFNSVIIRCPTIVDAGRLGLLGILFEFIDEGRKIWLVGDGSNVYQFIYAQDLIDACEKALGYGAGGIFNIGSDNVKSLKEVYEFVIKKAGTGSRVASLPKGAATFLMKMAYFLKLSPLGPYHYKMISEDFVFDNSKIKAKLQWRPTLTNEEMLYKAYEFYHANLDKLKDGKNVSPHKQTAKMGVIKLLKYVS